jgi:Domain of unknown function (DUF4352)
VGNLGLLAPRPAAKNPLPEVAPSVPSHPTWKNPLPGGPRRPSLGEPGPQASAPLAPAAKPKHTLRNVAIGVFILIFIIVIVVIAANLTPAPSSTSSSSPSPPASPSQKQSIAITYTTEQIPNVSPGEDALIVNMTSIHNVGYSSFDVNPLYFELTTGGVSYSYDASTFELTYALPVVTVQDNGTTSGALQFLIPSGSSGFSMGYNGTETYSIDWISDGSSSSIVVTITISTQTVSSIGYSIPAPGSEYLVVNLTINDKGYSSFDVSPLDFTVTTGVETYSYDPATFSLNNSLSDVELQSGGVASGGVAFQIPIDSTGYAFSYSTGLTGSYYNVNWVSA